MLALFKNILAALLAFIFCGHAVAAALTAHPEWAEKLIANVAAENNVYGSSPTIVTWPGVKGAQIYQNQSVCATFVSHVVKTANGISDYDFKQRMGGWSSPNSANYYNLIVGQTNFLRINRPEDIQRGDIVAAVYLPCANRSDTGHTMMALGPARLRTVDTLPLIPGTVQYELTIADSSASEHAATDSANQFYADTRVNAQGIARTGAGIGTLRLYKDVATGNIAGYTWSVDKNSVYYAVDGCRSIAVGRMQ